ncbi:MAG: CZB domain-containing protein [Pontibacterium sp.]
MPLKRLFKRSATASETSVNSKQLESDALLGIKLPNLEAAHNEYSELTNMVKHAITEQTPLTISEDLIGQDDVCILGRWLYGEGSLQFCDHPVFIELRHAHKDFHHHAAKLVAMVNANTMESRAEAFSEVTAGHYIQSVKTLKTALNKLEALS